MGVFSLLALAVPQGASAHHGKGHHPGGHCRNNPHKHNIKKEHPEFNKQERKEFRREHRHHKHECNKYPPGQARLNASGQSVTFPVQETPGGGFTVGMASIVAIGALGALLVVRRRWVFSSRR